MKKNSKKVFLFGIFLLFACLSSNAQNWANFKRYADANILIDTPPKVVFMGDSITDAWVNFCPEFFLENNFAGRGISGQVTSQMLLRFQRDVVSLHPKKVVILAGINDIAENQGPIDLKDTFLNICSMADIAKANGIEPIICSLLPANKLPWRKNRNPSDKVIELNKILSDYAKKNNIKFVDYYSAMVDENQGLAGKYGRPDKNGPDAVHPGRDGYLLMQRIVLEALK